MYMQNRYGVNVTQPSASWTNNVQDDGVLNPDYDVDFDDAEDEVEASGYVVSDDGEVVLDYDFFGGNSCTDNSDCTNVCPVSGGSFPVSK